MKWNLEVNIDLKPSFRKIEHFDTVLSIGSCFSEHMGQCMAALKHPVISNPSGILYNPFSIGRLLDRLLDGEHYTSSELIEREGIWVSLDHHSSYADTDQEIALRKMNDDFTAARTALAQTSSVIVTFGTAYYFTLASSGTVVGNCQKLPAEQFHRHRSSTAEIVATYDRLIRRVKESYPDIQWIFTISPVRHWKDGAADNHWSKSILTCAARELEQSFEQVHYFPSYEILMDELRDYRFYEEDLIHPNTQAVDHIWQRFSDHCFTAQCKAVQSEIARLNQRLAHRPLHEKGEAYQVFQKENAALVQEIKERYPWVKERW